ncbi:PREDICTED: RNA exonuclease 4 [Cyprinodon variegatus]|uniref:RNA exonuclease 4 n=1 Tax=Cyprinodon variegatus TaxID=28743 RepID=UPI000742A584|nr:PREDICTED: RNA exonuclease 4 [Cyprinodon variegatus]
MTKAKAKTAHPDAKTTAKDKRKKFWIKHNLKQKSDKTTTPKKHQEKPVPPQEPQQISANWKSLQQILKSSQTEKTHHNGVITTKNPEKDFKNTSTNSATLSQKDCGRKGKLNMVPAASKEAKMKHPASSDSQHSTAPKRKKVKEKPNSEQAAKKKKNDTSLVEGRKPTEEDLWFDDVDPDDIEETMGAEAAEIMRKKQGIHSRSKETDNALVKDKSFDGITKVVAIDCEMVGVGPAGEESILARVSLVNKFGKCIYDKYVKPTEKVTDYRTAVSGIRPEDIEDGEDIQTVQREVADILQGRIVVGHAIHNDLKILLLDHPKKKIRDTQKYKPFRRIAKSCRPSLKVLCKEVLNVKVQQGEHSSVQDAQATMRLYTLVRKQWEAEIKAGKKSKDSGEKKKRKPR